MSIKFNFMLNQIKSSKVKNRTNRISNILEWEEIGRLDQL